MVVSQLGINKKGFDPSCFVSTVQGGGVVMMWRIFSLGHLSLFFFVFFCLTLFESVKFGSRGIQRSIHPNVFRVKLESVCYTE